MKNSLLIIMIGLLLVPGTLFAQAACDWHVFHKFHEHVDQAIDEVEIARKANHYDMGKYNRKAEDFLRLAEEDLRLANNSTNSN